MKSITLQHIFKHIHSIHENYNSIHVHRKIRGNIFVVDFIRSNLKFLHHPLLFFTFIVNAGQYLISFEVQTMLTKFRQKMLMGIRASNFQLPISLVLIEEEEEKKKEEPAFFDLDSFVPSYVTTIQISYFKFFLLHRNVLKCSLESAKCLNIRRKFEKKDQFFSIVDASRNRTINDASVIQNKDYTFLQSKQTLNRCARVPLQFRWNKQTVFFARESRGCEEINEYRIEIERRLRIMMITIRAWIFPSVKLY